MDITGLNIEQLKALAYDQYLEFRRIETNIKTIEARIQEKMKEAEQTAAPDVSDQIKTSELKNP